MVEGRTAYGFPACHGRRQRADRSLPDRRWIGHGRDRRIVFARASFAAGRTVAWAQAVWKTRRSRIPQGHIAAFAGIGAGADLARFNLSVSVRHAAISDPTRQRGLTAQLKGRAKSNARPSS